MSVARRNTDPLIAPPSPIVVVDDYLTLDTIFYPKRLCLACRAEELKRNDGLIVRRAIMLPPIMAGEQEIAQEKEKLARAVRTLSRLEGDVVLQACFFEKRSTIRHVILKRTIYVQAEENPSDITRGCPKTPPEARE